MFRFKVLLPLSGVALLALGATGFSQIKAPATKILRPTRDVELQSNLALQDVKPVAHMVNSGYLRMRQPATLGRILSNLNGADLQRVSSAFVSHEHRAKLGASGQAGFKAFASSAALNGKWSAINQGANLVPGTTVKFGKHFVDPSAAPATEFYEGIATKSGVLTVDLAGLGPFAIADAFTETGDLDANGQPVVFQKMVKVAGNKLRTQVLEGQSYRIVFSLPLTTAGSKSGSVTLDDGTLTSVFLSGNVVVPAAQFNGAFNSSLYTSSGGSYVYADANVSNNGVVDPNVKWEVTKNPGNLEVNFPSANFGKKDSKTVQFTVTQTLKTPSGEHPLEITGTAFNGTKKIVLSTTIDCQLFWLEVSGQNYMGSYLLNISSDGDWVAEFTPKDTWTLNKGQDLMVLAFKSNQGWFNSGPPTNLVGSTMHFTQPKFGLAVGKDPYGAKLVRTGFLPQQGTVIQTVQGTGPFPFVYYSGAIKVPVHELTKG